MPTVPRFQQIHIMMLKYADDDEKATEIVFFFSLKQLQTFQGRIVNVILLWSLTGQFHV